jgi:hypothetical protein
MKKILCACWLVIFQANTATQAYEADIHYSVTYVLARAIGWSEADALTIASANQGVDENEDTVAAIEMESSPRPSSFHQAEKNLRFHCFSQTSGPAGEIPADVAKVMSARFAEVPQPDADPERNARRLIALGAALHCQQDAHAHVGFGGSCGSHAGSCYGHTYETLLDQVIFGLLKKHFYNPDHPGVSGERLLAALSGTVRELKARRPKGSLRSIPANELVALSDALRASGLELPDDVRLECNRYIAGKWLFDYFHAANRMKDGHGAVERLAPEVAVTCKNASLASATVIRIPDPRFPRLNGDASPYFVRADGTYQLVQKRDVETAGGRPEHQAHSVKVQVSHWSQLLALARQ